MSSVANGGAAASIGTAAGAAVGTAVLPGVGTAIGSVVGDAVAGLFGGGSGKDQERYAREQALAQRVVAGVSVGGVSADANAAAITLYQNASGCCGDNNPAITRQYAQQFINTLQQQGIDVGPNGVIQTNSAIANAGIAFASAFGVAPGSPAVGWIFVGLGILGVGAAVYFVSKGG
jgi:hypothetical protein